MLKTVKHQLRGAVVGSFITLLLVGAFLAPHTNFRISLSNQPAEQVLAQDQSVELAKLMPSAMPLPAHKPKVQ